MIEQERIKAYAEKLCREGILKRLTLRNIAVDLHLYLVQKKTESVRQQMAQGLKSITFNLGLSLTLNDRLIKPLENYFKSAFNQDFWLASAQAILSRMDTECPDQPDDDLEFMLINSCGSIRAGEILRDFEAWNLSVEVLSGLFEFIPEKPAPVTEPQLFGHKAIASVSTPPPIVSSTRSQLRTDLWKQSDGLALFQHQAKGDSKNYIEHYIASPGDITLLPWEDAKQIIDKFGFHTAKLQFIFAAHTMSQESPWKSSFSLKASDIVKDLDWGKNHKINKAERLNEVASLAYVLGCLTVKSVWVHGKHPKGGIDASTPIGRMWNITIEPRGQLSLEGKIENPDEIYLTIQPGGWTEVFLNKAGAKAKQALYQFGYLAQSVLQIDAYHDELALRLAIHLTLESRFHRSGEYRVETLLKELLPQEIIDEVRSDKDKGRDLKQRWNSALELLINLKWQIKFDDESYPEWLRPGSKTDKPAGWKKEKIIDQLLKAKITIQPPEPIPTWISNGLTPQNKSRQTLPVVKHLTGSQIRLGREALGWSQRKLAGFMEVSQPTINFWEQGKRTPDLEKEKKLKRLLSIED